MTAYKDIFIVHTMGKVASTSVYQSLKKHLPAAAYVAHCHFLNIPRLLRRIRNGDANPSLIGLVKNGFEILRMIRENPTARLTWISLVRDPVAREISNLVQNPWLIGRHSVDELNDSAIVPALEYLLRESSYNYTLTWFPEECLPATRLDVFQHPFDRKRGFTVIKNQYRNERLILIQLEKLNLISPDDWFDLVDVPLRITHHNLLSEKPSIGQAFTKAMKLRFRLDETVAEFIYSSLFMTHFYDPNQILEFRNTWVR